MLLAINVALVIYYLHYGTGFKTLVWIYWSQSVLIGIFNFLNLLTIERIEPGSITINNEPVKSVGQARGCISSFFALHFGLFHFVYMVFLFSMLDSNEALDWRLYEVSVGALFLDQLWNFIQAKRHGKEKDANLGALFFMPYARVIPMHLTILMPQFTGISAMWVFLPLKVFADMLMFAITMKISGAPVQTDPTVLETEKKF